MSDSAHGEWVCFGRLVESYGLMFDRAKALAAASRYAAKCVLMNDPRWIAWGEMAEVVLFCKVSKTWTNTYNERWSLYETETLHHKLGDAALAAATGDDGAPRRKIKAKTTVDEGGVGLGDADDVKGTATCTGTAKGVGGKNKLGEPPAKKAKPSPGKDEAADTQTPEKMLAT